MIIGDATADTSDAEGQVVCLRCGYSLRGLDARRPCPECGLLVGLSLLDGSELRHNRPRWLASLCAGAWLSAVGAVTAPGLAYAAVLLYSARSTVVLGGGTAGGMAAARAGIVMNWTHWAAGVAIGLAATLPLAAGVWLLTRASGRREIDEISLAARLGLRVLGLLPIVIVLGWALVGPRALSPNVRSTLFSATVVGLLLVDFAVLSAWLFWHLKALAARAPAPLLAADSPVVGIVLGLCLLFPFVIAALTNANSDLFPRGTEGTAMYVLVALWAAVGGTAFVWSVYLLLRYAAAFGRTARHARQLMREFDASRDPRSVAYDPAL